MKLRTIVNDSYYLLSDEEIPLVDLIREGKVNLEKIEIPEDIDSEQDEYELRTYLIEKEIDSLNDITFLWFSVDGYEGHDMVLYDIVKYKDKYLHLWLDED